jgi:hypothetical protein
MSVPVSAHQPSPGSTLAVRLDSTPDLSCTNSTQDDAVDAEHQPTDLTRTDILEPGPRTQPLLLAQLVILAVIPPGPTATN